jgi:hypothetical protein
MLAFLKSGADFSRRRAARSVATSHMNKRLDEVYKRAVARSSPS